MISFFSSLFLFCFCCLLYPVQIKVKRHITHRDLEGTVRDVLPSKTDADDILARLRRRVEDVERAVLVFNNVHVELRPLGCAHTARHLAFPSSLGVHCDDCLFANLDSRANTGTLRIEKKGSVLRFVLIVDLTETQTDTHLLSHTHSACTFHNHETRLKSDEI